MKDSDKAMEAVDKALEVAQEIGLQDFGKMAKLYARKASVYTNLQKYDEAINYYEKSLLEDSNDKVR